MRIVKRLGVVMIFVAAACGGKDDVYPVDAPQVDAAVDTPLDAADLDAADLDAADLDAEPDAPVDAAPDTGGALAGFGDITGDCGVLTLVELDGTQPLWFQGDLTFSNRYDDPDERDLLTPGGQQIMSDGNAGGSSVFSEVFAYEWLARCEQAGLVKTETQIAYDIPTSKKADLLVEIDGRKVGVSVTRAMTFPFGQPYTLTAATTLFERKLDDLQLATQHVVAADLWTKQMVVAEAYDLQHAQVAMQAWVGLDDETRGSAILIVAVTNGDDQFIYTDH